MHDLPLSAIRLAFLDFETTGLSPHRGDRICEVAVQRVVNGIVETSYTTLVNPQRPQSARSFAINQISAEQLSSAPTFSAIAGSLYGALADTVIVAHNAPFDLEFLHAFLGNWDYSLALEGRGLWNTEVVELGTGHIPVEVARLGV